ncbi:acyl-CoA dehydrogenase family protein [Dehalococcoidia bacterium]|jgi:alkylation response protein AidB-like acyl-CoA dehydrogenase|nr:acyl-CoA dehydrogenase family protein [Dehalococcoidia bacterium]
MDFQYTYSPEQLAFKAEVEQWLDENVPEDKRKVGAEEMPADLFDWAREFTKKLGAKGWLHPDYPTEYGGGGLSPEETIVITSALEERDVPMTPGNTLDLPALAVWGTEEQKQKYLRGRLTGELISYQNFTEPNSGSDLASLRTRAKKDGDEWVITGEKVFVSGSHGAGRPRTPDYLFTLAITDPDAPRHRNMGYFLVPTADDGVTLQPQGLLGGNGQNQVYMDDVRIGEDRLIGGAGQGWQVAQTTLEHEHGGRGDLPPKNRIIGNFLDWVADEDAADEHTQHAAVDAFIDTEILRLIGTRNHWMYEAKQEMSYHGSQNSLWRKEGNIRVADHIREVAGLKTLLAEGESEEAGSKGELEYFQRSSLVGAHPGGTIEVQKVIIARRIGVSRTKERAAPTPSTAKISSS